MLSIQQRNQQSHDLDLWKGQSAPLDLTSHVDPRVTFTVKICTYNQVKRPILDQIIPNGTKVVKEFLDEGTGQLEPFDGKVVGYDPEYKLYRILYSDGDGEEIGRPDLEEIMVDKPQRHLSGSYGINPCDLRICFGGRLVSSSSDERNSQNELGGRKDDREKTARGSRLG